MLSRFFIFRHFSTLEVLNIPRYEYIVEKEYVRVIINSARKGTIVQEILIDLDKLDLIKSVHISFKKYGERYIAQYYRSDMLRLNLTRLILGVEDQNILVTFKSENNFDFRKNNLICAARGVVGQNRQRNQKNNTSGVRGVTWNKVKQKWAGQVVHNGKNYHIPASIDKNLIEKAVIAKRKELLEFSFSDQ